MTVLPLPITEPSVRTTDLFPVVLFGPAATEDTEIGEPFDRTVKLPASGSEVLCKFSLYVTVRLNPLAASELVEYTGGVWSTPELFVTEVAENDRASFPIVS